MIFTDGSSRGNPGPGGFGAVVVYADSAGRIQVDELGGSEAMATNNRMEMNAALAALKHFEDYFDKTSAKESLYTIYTDSSYLINGITRWVSGWQRNNWQTKEKKEVLNKDLWQKLADISLGKKIKWEYIGGHRGIAGNERCDVIATAFADNAPESLYKGSLEGYKALHHIDILNIKVDPVLDGARSASKNRSSAKAYSYLSLVEGVLQKHKTWAECEKRVKGAKGAKYKKALDAREEKNIIEGWQR